jgi:glycosyltransferase involved in cell wall biosynthesis
VGNQVRLLARALVRQGHRISVIDLSSPDLPDVAREEGITIHRIRSSNWHWYLSRLPVLGRLLVLSVREIERSWAAYKCIRAIHQSNPIDLVEGTETGMLFLPLRMPDLPSIIRLHGEPYTFVRHTPDVPLTFDLRLSRLLQRLALRRVRLLLSPSARHAQEIREELGKGGPPLEIVPNALAEEIFALSNMSETSSVFSLAQPFRAGDSDVSGGDFGPLGPPSAPEGLKAQRSEGLKAQSFPSAPPSPALKGWANEKTTPETIQALDGPIVLFVGRLERGKGVLLLLQAASRVLADVPHAHFVLAGGRHPTLRQEDLEECLRQLPDRKRVHLLGHIPWEQLLCWYKKAALCALPSYYETFGLAALEAMAFGLPVVALSAGALPEVVEDQVTGLLVSPRDTAALAGAIVRLLKDPELRQRLGENGRRAAQRFLLAHHLRDNLELFSWASRSEPVTPGEHVFFSPHLDDIVLSCGGRIAAMVGRQEKVRAITVFAGVGKRPIASTFARHLHEKWGLRDSPAERLEEDRRAFQRLGVAEVEHWEFLDAPYRHNESGAPLYCTYDELKGSPAAADGPLVGELIRRVCQVFPTDGVVRRLYFPLGLGGHVDHQLLFQVGLHLRAEGWHVRFYEDWPYADAYEPSDTMLGWMSETVDISVDAKLAAVLEHRSQLPGLGGSAAVLKMRLTHYALGIGGRHPQERYWFLTPTRAARMVAKGDSWQHGPLRPKPQPRRLFGFRRIFSRLRSVQLTHLLPRGSGECLLFDGTDSERAAIEGQGYRCRSITSTQEREWIAPASTAAVVAWRPMEIAVAEERIRDACNLLSPGGVLVGRLSREDATKVMDSLARQGFRDIERRPNLGGPWRVISTWFRCRNVAFVARKAAVGAQCTSAF